MTDRERKMNWVKENKFLTGFNVVMLIGIGALGFELVHRQRGLRRRHRKLHEGVHGIQSPAPSGALPEQTESGRV
ncbi:MAG: hypothetical protein WDN28_13585 [Chthoniobacter sp.]